MGRENGYYWVRVNAGDWRIANWSAPYWFLAGIDVPRNEYVIEIDERRLVRPEEVK